MYFLATEITNRELAVMRCSRAACPSATNDLESWSAAWYLRSRRSRRLAANLPRSMRLARSTSSWAVSSGMRPISLRYSPTVSSVSMAASVPSSSSSVSFFFFSLGWLFFRPLADLDAVLHQHRKDFVEAVHIVFRLWENEHDFFERDVATLATGSQELLFCHRLFDDNCVRYWCCQNLFLFHC